jgi:Rrf2 family transcriptional regulator, nitric oxide-sensitive transcriptional repressor
MQLTLHADYSLRILLYLTENSDRYVSTREISEAYGISRNHLVRVVQTLHANGFVEVSEGRSGGVKLARDPAEINLGQVVRKTEPNFRIVECFDMEMNTCPIVPVCRLKGILAKALESFLAVLDDCALSDLIHGSRSQSLSQYLQIGKMAPRN